jgi:hypothetical protein
VVEKNGAPLCDAPCLSSRVLTTIGGFAHHFLPAPLGQGGRSIHLMQASSGGRMFPHFACAVEAKCSSIITMNAEPAWKTYLKISIAMIPTFIFALFFVMIIFPRVESILEKAGLLGENPAPTTALFRFIVNWSHFAFDNFYFILLVIGGALTMAEIWFNPWDRMRKPACVVLAVLFNAFVLIAMTASIVTALVAVSLLQRAQSP